MMSSLQNQSDKVMEALPASVHQDSPRRVGRMIETESLQAQIVVQLIQINGTHAISCSV